MGSQETVKQLEDCSVANFAFEHSAILSVADAKRRPFLQLLRVPLVFYAMGTWVFSVAGALLAIPVGIKRKSLAPLVFFGTTGTMLDIIMGITQCEREHAERQAKLLEAQTSATDASFAETGVES